MPLRSRASSPDGVVDALKVYEGLRHERATTVQQTSRTMGYLFDMVEREQFEDRDERIRRSAPFYHWLGAHDADGLVVPEPAPAR